MYAIQRPFGHLPDGREITRIVLDNGCGMSAEILTLGAVLHRLMVPDRQGVAADVTLGQDTAQDYWRHPYGVGMVVGRCANRIANACYRDGDRLVKLEANASGFTLHSASGNWGRHVFQAHIPDPHAARVQLTLTDDAWAGFPGRLELCVTYTLEEDQTLRIDYDAICTERTVLNPTHHMFLNLAGQAAGSIADQLLEVSANAYLPARPDGLPTGEIRALDGSALDVRQPKFFRSLFASDDPDIAMFGGLDHNYCLHGDGYRRAGSVTDPVSGRRVTVYTDMPGIQVYTFNGLPHALSGKDGAQYVSHCAFCLETQHYPNAVNEPRFPSALVPANTPCHSVTAYRFDVAAEGI